MSDKYLIVVLGPTASGKTALGIELAKYYKTDVVSADSRQVYKGLNIGTAQPTYQERLMVRHHLVDFVDLDKVYTVADYEKDSLIIINSLFKEVDIVVMVGGTGLYIRSVCSGLDKIPSIKGDVNTEVDLMYTKYGLAYCVNELKKLDKYCHDYIDLKNKNRVIRALKVIKSTGHPIYTFFNKTVKERDFKKIYIGLNLDKQVLLDRINIRTNNMISAGLVDEAIRFKKYRYFNSLQTIGYKEVYEELDNGNGINLTRIADKIKLKTRQYAKRQMTWFRKNKDIMWFNTVGENIIESINNMICFK